MSRRGNFVTEGKFSLKNNLSNTFAYMFSGVGRCQKVGGGTQTRDLSTFGKELI